MRHVFHPEPLADYEDAVRRYERERDARLGSGRYKAVEATLLTIEDAPDRLRVFADGEIRRVLTRVFPYGILYAIDQDYVVIVAVAHCSRKPDYWKSRLE